MGENWPDMMTSQEVADLFRLSKKNGWQTVQTWARTGKIKAVKIGDLWRFPRENVLRFIRAGSVQ